MESILLFTDQYAGTYPHSVLTSLINGQATRSDSPLHEFIYTAIVLLNEYTTRGKIKLPKGITEEQKHLYLEKYLGYPWYISKKWKIIINLMILDSNVSRTFKIPIYKDIIYLTWPDNILSKNNYIKSMQNTTEKQLCKCYGADDTVRYIVKLDEVDFIEHLFPTSTSHWKDTIDSLVQHINNFRDRGDKIFDTTLDTMAAWLEDVYYEGKNIIDFYLYAHGMDGWQGKGFFVDAS